MTWFSLTLVKTRYLETDLGNSRHDRELKLG